VFKPGDEHVDQRDMATASQQLAIYVRRVLIGCALMALVVLGIAVATATRWQAAGRDTSGFVARHPVGL
jgi:hypothetical protein